MWNWNIKKSQNIKVQFLCHMRELRHKGIKILHMLHSLFWARTRTWDFQASDLGFKKETEYDQSLNGLVESTQLAGHRDQRQGHSVDIWCEEQKGAILTTRVHGHAHRR